MIDSLIQYLLEEIAMDGDEGTSIQELATFISDFYSSQSQSSTSSSSTTTTTTTLPQQQQVDDDFLQYIWNTLVEQPDVRVGVLTMIPPPPSHDLQREEGGAEGSQPVEGSAQVEEEKVEIPPPPPEDEEESDLKPLKKPRRKPGPTSSSTTTSSTLPTHELTLLSPLTASLGYPTLLTQYPPSQNIELRVIASSQTAWRAITGSHSKPTSITPMVWQMLQMVSRGRGEGVTAVRLSRELGVDPKSVFHYIKVPQELGIVKKFSAIDEGSRTNRILHVRYLETSPHWKIHTAREGGGNPSSSSSSLLLPTPPSQDQDQDEEGGGRVELEQGGQMSTISALYLSTNPDLVRGRVVRALKARKDWWMQQNEMASTIGLHSYSPKVLRRLNSILNGLCLIGVLEKIAITKKKGGGAGGQGIKETTVQALRLLDPTKLYTSNQSSSSSSSSNRGKNEESFGVEDEGSYPLANTSMERQILDLLIEADTRGLTGTEISDTLGHHTLRTVDATLQRLGRQTLPSKYRDMSTTSLTETIGRMKQTRWFSLGGYVSMRRERGNPDLKAESNWEQGRKVYEQSCVGNVGETVGGGQQWMTKGEREKSLKRWKTMDHVGKGVGTGKDRQVRKKNTSTAGETGGGDKKKKVERKKVGTASKGKGKGKGKEKAKDQDNPGMNEGEDGYEESEEGGINDDEDAEPRPVKPRGRPRKHPVQEGKESWYQRKKRLDAERIARGEEPEESYYSRKKREEKEDKEREDMGLPKLDRKLERKATSARKSIEPKIEEGDQNQEEKDELQEDESPPAPPPKSRKRGRPSKSAPPPEEEDDVVNPVPSPPPGPPAKKKRGRLSELDKLLAAAREVERSERDGDSPASAGEDADQDEAEEEEEGEEESVARQRNKKRARFSLAVEEQEVEGEKESQPQQPTRRRGRSSGPPLVPGPELDGAPVRTPPVVLPPSSSASTSTPKPPPSSSTSRRHPRLKAVVEIDVRSKARTPKSRIKSSSSSQPLPPSTPIDPQPQSSDPAADNATSPEPEPVSTPSASAGPSSNSLPQPPSTPALDDDHDDVLPSPPPVLPSPPPSFAMTPAPSSQPASSQSTTKVKRQSRKSVTSKDNLTALTRQKEILDYIEGVGGIVDAVPRLGEYIRDHAREQNPSVPVFTMDRHVVTSTLGTLAKRDQLRKTTTIGVKGDRHDIYYLPSVTLDSAEMISFLDKILRKEKPAHWDRLDRAQDIVIDEAVEGGADGGGGTAQTPTSTITGLPKPEDDFSEVKDYFRRQPGVVGASYGARHGTFSRARQLHKWLASFIFSDPPPHEYLAHQDSNGYVLTHATFVSAMPLCVFTRIVPLPIESDELRTFLDDSNNYFLPLNRVPANIHSILRPSLNKRKQAVWNTLSTLMTLNLLTPLVASGGIERNKSYIVPNRPQAATHWRFNTTVPVYAFAEEETPLVTISQLEDLDSITEFWSTLQQLSTVILDLPRPTDEATLAQSGFPLHFEGFKSFLTKLRIRTKWKDSYHLIPDQRTYLSRLVRADPGLVDDSVDRSKDIETLADALYAPVDVVVEYLHAAEKKARKAAESELNAGRRKKRRRVRKSEGFGDDVGEGGGESEDIAEEEEENQASSIDPATALHRKVRELAAQRERDWTTLVDKFLDQHEQPKLDQDIVDYLHRRFIDPRKQIDAPHLLFELRQLLPEPPSSTEPQMQEGADDQFKTIVPQNLRRRARQAKDPYAITRQPTIRKRVRATKSKGTSLPRPRIASAAPSSQPSYLRQSPQPIEHGDQNEFLSQPAAPRPAMESGKRVRNYYSSEQDELLLDAVAILKARVKTIDSRISYGVLERLFKGHKASTLRSRSIVLLKKPEEQAYHDRLVDAWLEIYAQRKEEEDENLRDPNEKSMTDFDIASFIRCLRQHVDKRALRLTRSIAKPPPPSLVLPSSLVALRTGYSVKPTSNAVKSSSKWENYWVGAGVASNDREASVAQASIATRWEGLGHKEGEDDEKKKRAKKDDSTLREQALTSAAIKMVIATSNESYTPAQGDEVLRPFELHLDSTVQQLKNHHVIISASSEEERRVPGRNYSFDDKFLDRMDSTRVTMERLSDAVQFEKELDRDGFDGIFPIIPTEGEIMALIDLVSEGKVELSIDTSTLSEKTTRFDDFGTRQANDDDIECTVQIESIPSSSSSSSTSSSTSPTSLPLPNAFLPSGSTDDLSKLSEAKKQLFTSSPTDPRMLLAKDVLRIVETRAEKGATLSELCALLPSSPRHSILSSLSILIHSSPPLLLLTTSPTSIYPIYVSPLHLSLYSIPSPAPSHPGQYLYPHLWIGLDGQINRESYTRSQAWLRGLLWKRSNLLFREIMDLTKDKNHSDRLFTNGEVIAMLTSLEKDGIVERVGSAREGEDGEGEVDWEMDRWRLKGVYWNLGSKK